MNSRSPRRKDGRRALAVLGAVLLGGWICARRYSSEWRQHRAATPQSVQRTVHSGTPAARERPGWIAELERDLAASPPFGIEEPETAAPGNELRQLLDRLARQDPVSALAAIRAVSGDATVRHKMAAIVVRTWAANDPAAAWTWACASEKAWSCPDRPPLCCAALQGMALSAPDYVVTLVTARATATADFDLIAPATAALLHAGQVQRAENALLQWSRDLPANAIAPVVVELMVNELSRRSPNEALAWLESLPSSTNRNDGEATLAARWAETAPRDAVVWAAAMSSRQPRDSALEMAFHSWSERDPEAAIDWLAQNPGEPTYDRLIEDLVSRPAFRSANPRQAVQLAETIHDDNGRNQALKAAILTWSGFDHSSAIRYACELSGISETQRAEIVRAVRQHSDFPAY